MRAICLIIMVLTGCAGQLGPVPARLPNSTPKSETLPAHEPDAPDEINQMGERYRDVRPIRTLHGKATYYSPSLAGRPMASGERYDPNRAQAAHRTLPFGTVVRVTRIDSQRSVVVRVTDRGPFGGKGRIIDLSHAAAERLGILRAGVADVRVDVLKIPSKR